MAVELEAAPEPYAVIKIGELYWCGFEHQAGPEDGAVRFVDEEDARRVIRGMGLAGVAVRQP